MPVSRIPVPDADGNRERPLKYIIRASRPPAADDARELWSHRELLYFLVWRDLKVKYRQTALGIAWALLQPLLAMVVFSLFFGRLAGIDAQGAPYPVFALTALVAWNFFAAGLSDAAHSLIGSRHLITKIYFPRLAIPFGAVVAALADAAIGLLLLLGVMAWYGIAPALRAFAVLPLLAVALVAAAGVGAGLAALNVRYRDVRYVLPFLMQLWLFATPVVYPSSLVPGEWRLVYALNPMVGVVDGCRWALLGTPWPGSMLLVSAGSALLLACLGVSFFRRVEPSFADVV